MLELGIFAVGLVAFSLAGVFIWFTAREMQGLRSTGGEPVEEWVPAVVRRDRLARKQNGE